MVAIVVTNRPSCRKDSSRATHSHGPSSRAHAGERSFDIYSRLAERADRVHRNARRRPGRQPRGSPSSCTWRARTPRRTSPCTSNSPGGQRLRRPGDLRHDAVHQAGRADDLLSGVAMSMGSLLLTGRARPASARRCRTAAYSSTSLSGGFRGPVDGRRDPTHARSSSWREHIDGIYSRHNRSAVGAGPRRHGARPLLHSRAGARVRADRPGDRLARADTAADGLRCGGREGRSVGGQRQPVSAHVRLQVCCSGRRAPHADARRARAPSTISSRGGPRGRRSVPR